MAKNIMFQGTGSTVGKSIMTAALCRILSDDGYKVAPFKSQNMALNSFVTEEGKEMGRAQVVQAEAARVKPQVEMNPVLLKPTSDIGSQVIVNGEVYKNLSASVYYDHKNYLIEEVMKSYGKLDTAFDIIVIEGAGSPAEINLRENDIVNMGLAELVDAPVILIGDIDKGGVFASIYGTYMLLNESEQKRIKGYIINKFRGDVNLLTPGIDMFFERLPIPCLGVVPFSDIQIDDEDSVTDRFDRSTQSPIQIGVVKLPYLSNFTDFTVLELEPDVGINYISSQKDFESADIIVIPGSKNTIKDLQYLKNEGIDQWIYKAHRNGKPILGICGGYQMLGNVVLDPDHVESDLNQVPGLGLLNISTVMAENKTTIQSSGHVINKPSQFEGVRVHVSGYEIHMGITTLASDVVPFILLDNGQHDGGINLEGNVYGTYLHGIFDSVQFRKAILDPLRSIKKLQPKESLDYNELKEQAYDKLGDLIRNHVDIEMIKKIAGVL